ncbi:hypothetical protein NDU88_010710 [Pleurodeles waltl]|uniref:Uncharacterized protein n=1 Tax=Pleurodeles waltl TaxID=8319 RepID=A0AAV7S3D6_PLEWA|nr:hypothetical protein NDU88_010710 [Pleurodeles waltl]
MMNGGMTSLLPFELMVTIRKKTLRLPIDFPLHQPVMGSLSQVSELCYRQARRKLERPMQLLNHEPADTNHSYISAQSTHRLVTQ